jgi:dTDP-4-dehydrorhamnose 3,5-epimerase
VIRVVPSGLDGVLFIEPVVHRDDRGFLVETFREDHFRDAGLGMSFVQENHSRSVHNTLRGLHYQSGRGQAKLVRVANGSILDVAVDIRPHSATFGRHVMVELDDETHRQILIPEGFAHGFIVLSAMADVVYRMNKPYDAALERGVAWDDPDLGIRWPTDEPLVSARDLTNPRLAAIAASDLPSAAG